VRVHLADWPEVGNGQTGAVLGQQQGSKGNGQASGPQKARSAVALERQVLLWFCHQHQPDYRSSPILSRNSRTARRSLLRTSSGRHTLRVVRPWVGFIIKGFDMLTISAVIRVKKGHEDTMRRALLEVAENVRVNEPGTIGFFVSQEQENPSVFTTYERFLDQAAMDAHNDSQVVARFFGIAKPILDGDVILVTSNEISAKA
jgi:quinol monooxygenase YgiN